MKKMSSPKSAFVVLVLAIFVATEAATAPPKPALRKLRPVLQAHHINYVFTAHAKAVATICRNSFQENRRLCLKTLKHVQSDDPLDLFKASLTAGNEGVKKSIAYLDGLKTKYQNNNMGMTYIESCKHYLGYALDSYQEIWQAIGKDWNSLAKNYVNAVSSMDSAYSYHSTCLNDIMEEDTLEVFTKGIDVSKNLTMTAQGLMRNMDGVVAGFGLKVSLPQIAKPLNVEDSM